MALQYANSQPAGFQNYVKNIAIVGAGGRMGGQILKALIDGGKHNITILSRPDSESTFPAGVTVRRIDYESQASLVSAMQGQDVLIITQNNMAPHERELNLVRAAAEAGVRWIFPNEWAQDFANPALERDVLVLGPKFAKTRALIEQLGVSGWLVVTSGFWYEHSLGGEEMRYGFDFNERRLTLFDDGRQKLNTTTWVQIARAVASLLSFKILPEDESDTSEKLLSRFRNRQCYMSSFLLSQRDMWASVMRVTGTKESDWTVQHEDIQERYRRGVDLFKKGDHRGLVLLMYARSFFPDGAGDYESTKGISNELLGLPQEDLDACTRTGIDIFQKLYGK